MSRPDEELSALYRETTARTPARPGCPEPEALVRVATGAAEVGERDEVARHVADCSDCALELQSVRRAVGTASGIPSSRPPLRFGTTWMAAAALVLLAVVPVFFWRASAPPEETLRGDGVLAVQPASDAELTSPPRELAWPAQPGASSYRVRLFDARAEPIWESGPTVEPRVALPEDVVRALSGATDDDAFLWSVEVEGDVARSRLGPFWFRVVRDPIRTP